MSTFHPTEHVTLHHGDTLDVLTNPGTTLDLVPVDDGDPALADLDEASAS